MLKKTLLWTLAVLITLSAAVYQRLTGPTHPQRGHAALGSTDLKYRLLRSNEQSDAPVELKISDPLVQGALFYKRYKVSEAWTEIPLQRSGEQLTANLPMQPPAGKLEYYVRLTRGDETVNLPHDGGMVIRFTGDVPRLVLLPHIFLMFFAMLISNRAALEALSRQGKPRRYAFWAAGLLFAGGFIFGPLVERYAFGYFWTGIPFGWDLTDNKTLIAMVGWLIPIFALRKGRSARVWIILAAVILLAVFSIPHSMMGSELNYQTGQVGTSGVD